jgi:hypothetical protein
MAKFDEPREVEIQWTYERARAESDEDEDSLDEDATSDVNFLIGQSRETREINSWDEIPDGFELVSPKDSDEYDSYFQNNDFVPEDDEEEEADVGDEEVEEEDNEE